MYNKSIRYDREAHDYAMYLDGELVGFARTYYEAEITLDQLVFELLSAGRFHSATELDGAQGEPPPDDCWTESPHAPSLSQAIAIGLVGNPDPTCEHCGAPAFVWCDSHMYCRSWWHTGVCQVSSADWADVPDRAVLV